MLPGCRKAPRHFLERVEVVAANAAEANELGLDTSKIEFVLLQELRLNGHFILPSGAGEKRSAATRLELEISPVRESRREGPVGVYANLELSALIRQKTPDGWSNYEIVRREEEKISGDSLDEKQAAAQKALRTALHQLVLAIDLQLAAIDKSDSSLIKDLRSEEANRRDAAIRILADRKNPAVRDALVEKLKSADQDEVRRAIGGLVELKDRQAVPPLIELARGRDLMFIREIVYALGAVGGEEAQAYLFTVAKGHDDREIRDSAQQALLELESKQRKERELPDSAAGHALQGKTP
jgi:hypothetical protein